MIFFNMLFCSFVKLSSTGFDLRKREFGSQTTTIEIIWKGDFLIFRLEENPTDIFVDGILQSVYQFLGQTDDGIRGVFIYNNNTWQGSFTANNTVYHVFPEQHPRAIKKRDGLHFITEAEDNEFECQTTGNRAQKQSIQKRSNVNCPEARKILPVCIAVDCNYYNLYKDLTSANVLQEMGLASLITEDNINVGLGIVKIDIRTSCGLGNDNAVWNQQCSPSNVISKLNEFTKWRGTQDGTCGVWHLVTQCSYTPTLGIAWIGQACQSKVIQQSNDFVSGTGLSSVTNDGFRVVAHEIMHNLGASHDCVASQCDQGCNTNSCDCCPCDGCDCKGQYLMHPSLTLSSKISSCTKSDVCGGLPFVGTCLKEELKLNFKTIPFCGNGIIEGSEECDPGSMANNCCTADCKLVLGAQCSDTNHGCCENCKISASGKTCRNAQNECDLAEICNGSSIQCPTDAFKSDGTSCSKGRCSSGLCTNKDDQCALKGGRLGFTKGCTTGCTMMCMGSNGICTDTQSLFLDGTDCQLNGKCSQGICSFDNSSDKIISWISENAIAFGVMITVISLVSIYLMLKYRKSKKGAPPTPIQ
eukprot:NODE_60_length_27201_cov_1.043318.p5 type:complete len:585 gc:universal NODE_60_length_27201_cov_1.043318:16340-18094(+)